MSNIESSCDGRKQKNQSATELLAMNSDLMCVRVSECTGSHWKEGGREGEGGRD
jgi:hypothetical protein